MRLSRLALSALALALAAAGAQAQAQEAGGPAAPLKPVSGTAAHAMVSAANPLAVAAGVKVLRAGGDAIDAAVAIQAVLGLVEPQSSGLGGGGFMVYYDAKTKQATAYDGRETAPAGATPDMFEGPDGRPLPFGVAVLSGRATGVPGAIAALALAHKDHGRLPWKSLFGDAMAMGTNGFVVPQRLGADANADGFAEAKAPDVIAYLTKPDGTKIKAGDTLKNPAYAATLRRLADEGIDALLEGKIAADIVARTHDAPLAGTLTLADLANYRPGKSEALCRPYRAYLVCTPGLPSGGPAVQELMGILEHTDIAAHGPADPQGWYLFTEASRLAYADRDQYEGDATFVSVPLAGLLDPAYLKARAALIGATAVQPVVPGHPMGALARGPDNTLEPGGTSNFVVADQWGDVLTMTTTVESIFGTGRMVDGFFLNNQLTDFSFAPKTPAGAPVANAVAPGKRPRSSMAPTLVLDGQGRFVVATGSPGGNSIIAYVAKTLVADLDWKLPIPEAIALPNLVARGDVVGPESNMPAAIVAGLTARGEKVAPARGEESGLHGIAAAPGGYLGGADPRREGMAAGF